MVVDTMADDLDVVRRAMVDRCAEIACALLGAPSDRTRNQLRWGSHGKIRLKLATGGWKDFSTGEWGDMFDLAKREMGFSFIEAVEWVRSQLGQPRRVDINSLELMSPRTDEEQRALAARTLYDRGRPARALGEGYFAARGLDYPEPLAKQLRIADIWFHGWDGAHKALLMPFRSFASLEVMGVHRIALNLRHDDGKRVKRSSGNIWGSAMMLGRKGPVLGICEGLETGVAITMGDPGVPIWCLSGSAFMAGFSPTEGVERLIIYADNDDNGAGQKAAQACSRLWREHADVEIVVPQVRGKDFADIWRRA